MSSAKSSGPKYGTKEYFIEKSLKEPLELFRVPFSPSVRESYFSVLNDDSIMHNALQQILGIHPVRDAGKDIKGFFTEVPSHFQNLEWKPTKDELEADQYRGKKYLDIATEANPELALKHGNIEWEEPQAVTTDAIAIERLQKESRFNLLHSLWKRASKHDLTGPVIAIGGSEDKTAHGDILQKFFELSGGEGSDIAVITWASRKSDAGKNYQKIFKSLGAKDVFLIKKHSKKESEDLLKRVAGIFFIGGDQMRLIKAIEELGLRKLIHSAHKSGTTIGGTSAGASILGEHMPYWDIDKEKMIYHKGLGLIPNSIIDQHFTQRHRQERLKDGVSRFKGITGYGLDEDTGLIFDGEKKPKKIGKGKVSIIAKT